MTFQNFQKAREAMVVSQLQPSGVVDVAVNDAFFSVPREDYAPEQLRGVCYLDDDLLIGQGRFMLEPLPFALMVQNAGLTKKSNVLDIGTGTGYSAAILSVLSGKVTAVDSSEKLLHSAKTSWEKAAFKNITPVLGRHCDGYKASAPYDAIFINGAVGSVPHSLMSQLSKAGRLYCIMRKEEEYCGKVTVFKLSETGQLISESLGDAFAPYLEGFVPDQEFEL
ncbi:MAG: protein-L-isoaspartate O-methyltransferase [Pseudobdellovibrionaceae bacterium]|jgi:protein-L-isoaspartate(D-aspartate) O-methyltransferase|nr:protein-L-isoaspartate O-methyltransferase [Pseudobdellovibrionaceae bacterium]